VNRFFRASLIAVLTALPARAAEGAPDSEGPGELWTALNFLILAGFLGYLIAKNLGPYLATRGQKIQEGLAAGEKAKSEADARAAVVQAQLDSLGAEIERLRAAALEDREREAGRIRRETEAELARILQHAEQEIESAGKVARQEVRRYASKLAIELAETKLRARMSPDVQAGLLQNFLGDVADGRAKAQTS
jgi:F-type H+-transporting ATPase subunit b